MLINLSGAEQVPFPDALKTIAEIDDTFGIFKHATGEHCLQKPLLASPQGIQKPTAANYAARNEKICILDLSNSNLPFDAPDPVAPMAPMASNTNIGQEKD